MSKLRDYIDEELATWLREQHIFFVGTAPLSEQGHINCSPKGGDSFRVLGPLEVAYQDYTGSGAETVAHLRENGRIVLMFCGFQGKPDIVRLHGTGEVILADDARFETLAALFPPNPGTRAFVMSRHARFDFLRVRSAFHGLPSGAGDAEQMGCREGPEALADYRQAKNVRSIDDLAAFGGE